MKAIVFSSLLVLSSIFVQGQVVKYKSLNYDIEKPNVEGYETKYLTTYHTVDFGNSVIKYEYFTADGNKVSRKYPINAIYDEGTYFRFSINSSGVKNIWVSRSPYNIEYEFSSGIKFVYYEITQLQ